MYIFTERKTKEVVGTVAIKWIEHNDTIIVYVGNVVVLGKYQRNNFLSHILFKVLLRTFWKFPMKKICFSCFMTTPKAYNIVKRFPYHYPKVGTTTPNHMLNIMKRAAIEVTGGEYFDCFGNYILIHNFKKRKMCIDGNDKGNTVKSYNGYFERVNPDFKRGSQLLLLFPIGIRTVWGAFKGSILYFHGKIRRQIQR